MVKDTVSNSDNSPASHIQAEHNESSFNPVAGEMALWKAVITQALMDAGSESKKPEAQHEKAKAIRWLLGFSEDFITVCLNAGLKPDYVRDKAKAAIARGCVWRQGMESRRTRTTPSATNPSFETKQTNRQLTRAAPAITLRGQPVRFQSHHHVARTHLLQVIPA